MKRLILNADDLGYDPKVTEGLLRSMREGVVSSCTFMVNTPHSESAAEAARGLAVGLHLNLARYAPLSSAFAPALLVRGELAEPNAAKLPAEAVKAETLAQLDRLQALLGRRATHVDVHKHLHRHPGVLEGLAAAALARGLPVRAIDGGMRARLRALGVKTTDHFIGDAGATAYWTLAQLEESLHALEDGVTELMCHPGHAPSTLTSGYSAQREVELATFLSPRARDLIADLEIQVGNFGDSLA